MGLFSGLVPESNKAAEAKLVKGPRPFTFHEALVATGADADTALAKTLEVFVRATDETRPVNAASVFFAARAYAKTHPRVVTTKDGRSVSIIDGWNGFKRPMAAIRAMLEGKSVKDADGLMLHVVDMVHGSAAPAYLAFMALYDRVETEGPAFTLEATSGAVAPETDAPNTTTSLAAPEPMAPRARLIKRGN